MVNLAPSCERRDQVKVGLEQKRDPDVSSRADRDSDRLVPPYSGGSDLYGAVRRVQPSAAKLSFDPIADLRVVLPDLSRNPCARSCGSVLADPQMQNVADLQSREEHGHQDEGDREDGLQGLLPPLV
jgi:hypothetical protein